MENFSDAVLASSMANWRLFGKGGLVKVTSKYAADVAKMGPDLTRIHVRGYIGIAKYLSGLNARGIEQALGLPPGDLSAGAYVYALTRLPTFREVDFKYSLAWPDGKMPSEADYKALLDRRDAAYGGASEGRFYPPGGAHIPQWRLNFAGDEPGIPGNLLDIVTDSTRFRSDKLHSPHNRPANWGRILT